MNYFLIPGNPPAVYFYELWKKEMAMSLPGSKVHVSPYPLLPMTHNSEAAMQMVFGAHKKALLEFKQEVQAPVTIIGHSLGGNFALRLLEDVPEEIAKVVLLHPFLRAPKKRGKLILKTVAAFYQREHLRKIVIKHRRYLEYLSSELPFVTDEEMEKSFHLAQHESVIISPDESPVQILPEQRSKVRVFYHPEDTWCPQEVLQTLRGQVSMHECTEPHGFITMSHHRASLLEKILA